MCKWTGDELHTLFGEISTEGYCGDKTASESKLYTTKAYWKGFT